MYASPWTTWRPRWRGSRPRASSFGTRSWTSTVESWSSSPARKASPWSWRNGIEAARSVDPSAEVDGGGPISDGRLQDDSRGDQLLRVVRRARRLRALHQLATGLPLQRRVPGLLVRPGHRGERWQVVGISQQALLRQRDHGLHASEAAM